MTTTFKHKTITNISSDWGFIVPNTCSNKYEGVVVTLDDNSAIYFGIEIGSQCCEEYGFIEANEFDNYNKFIEAEILEVSCIRDPKVHFKEIVEFEEEGASFMWLDTEFINIKTTKGIMNFAVYNYHNGFYGHDVTACYMRDKSKINFIDY